jgi:hypothetical protein
LRGFALYENNIIEIWFIQKVFLGNYITKDIKINCYALDKFFVEVVYDATHNIITKVRRLNYGHSFDEYVSRFD